MSKFLKFIPLIFIVGYAVSMLLLKKDTLDPVRIVETIRDLYKIYGYYLVFTGAFLEGTFLVGFYIPGSTIILLGAAFSKEGIGEFPLIILLGTLGLVCGYCVNYMFGKYGWFHILSRLGLEKGVEIAQEKLSKHKIISFLIGYFYPGSASFLSTAAGVVKYPFLRFVMVSVIAQLIWSMFWGGLAYIFGLPLVEFLMNNLIFGVLIIAALWFLKRYILKK